MINILKTTAIQNELIHNYPMYNITDQEFICICQLLTFDPLHVDLAEFLRNTNNNKPMISSLVSKNIINIGEQQGKMKIDLSLMYNKLENPSEKLNEIGLSANQIDKLTHIFGHSLKPHEINQINSWMGAGATFNKIEEAIYSALARDITNLNYIQKIIENGESTNKPIEQTNSPIKRNWTY